MSGENKAAIDVQGTSIPILSQDMAFISIEFEGIRDEAGGRNTLRGGVF